MQARNGAPIILKVSVVTHHMQVPKSIDRSRISLENASLSAPRVFAASELLFGELVINCISSHKLHKISKHINRQNQLCSGQSYRRAAKTHAR